MPNSLTSWGPTLRYHHRRLGSAASRWSNDGVIVGLCSRRESHDECQQAKSPHNADTVTQLASREVRNVTSGRGPPPLVGGRSQELSRGAAVPLARVRSKSVSNSTKVGLRLSGIAHRDAGLRRQQRVERALLEVNCRNLFRSHQCCAGRRRHLLTHAKSHSCPAQSCFFAELDPQFRGQASCN